MSWGRGGGRHSIVAEAYLPADPELFIASAHSEHWKRAEGAEYHLAKLQEPDNPLSRRVAAWEDLAAQPQQYQRSPHCKHDAWRLVPTVEDGTGGVYGDDAFFRDLPSWAEQMDRHKGLETCYKLSEGKPSPYEPDHASSIVFYKAENNPARVAGSVVYDSLGQARVDVNFRHHHMVHGRYQILSGHWHILAVGSHSHEEGLENHFDYRLCPWIWQAIPKEFNVIPSVPVGQ